ncbi:MAG: hypothetical protein CBARDMAM_7045 [uncultured Caballeronia sp.]|nr:MAG: hypothetical protein CBARDMAM_7045 [uncultured Caballeronia sp.]
MVLKSGSVYFLLTSQAARWFPSQAAYATSTSMLGPWFAATGLGNGSTFGGQNADVRSFAGARWYGQHSLPRPSRCGAIGRDDGALWLPVLFDPAKREARLDCYSRYTVDLKTGTLGLPLRLNLAAGRPGTTSSTAPGSSPDNANEGDYRTEWVAASPAFPAWWMVDLGAPKHISEVDISWWIRKGSEARYVYAIETSSDGVHFRTLERLDNPFYGFTVDKPDVTARYVRIRLTGATMANSARNWYVPPLIDVRIFS